MEEEKKEYLTPIEQKIDAKKQAVEAQMEKITEQLQKKHPHADVMILAGIAMTHPSVRELIAECKMLFCNMALICAAHHEDKLN